MNTMVSSNSFTATPMGQGLSAASDLINNTHHTYVSQEAQAALQGRVELRTQELMRQRPPLSADQIRGQVMSELPEATIEVSNFVNQVIEQQLGVEQASITAPNRNTTVANDQPEREENLLDYLSNTAALAYVVDNQLSSDIAGLPVALDRSRGAFISA